MMNASRLRSKTAGFALNSFPDINNDFAKACESMRLTPVQFKRTVKRVTTNVIAHLEEAFDRSFLSDDFKTHCRVLVRERLAVFR